MPLRRILSLACPMICAACLVAGYAANGGWIAVAAGVSTGLIWLLSYKRPASLPPSVALVISVVWGAVGLLVDAAPFLMILGTTLALASWDLMLLDHTLTSCANSSAQTIRLFENRHYQSLALALGPGLLIVIAGRMIQFEIPLGGMIVLVILAMFSLDRIWRTLNA
jgi:hypothetical protein